MNHEQHKRRAAAAEHDIVARLGKCTCEARPGEGGEWVAAFGDLPLAGRTETQG